MHVKVQNLSNLRQASLNWLYYMYALYAVQLCSGGLHPIQIQKTTSARVDTLFKKTTTLNIMTIHVHRTPINDP